MIGIPGFLSRTAVLRVPASPAFAGPAGHLEALLTPQPIDAFAVHQPALLTHQGRDHPIPVAGITPAQLPELRHQRLVRIAAYPHGPLGGSRLAESPACPTLGH